jgi:hypothetical protein
MTDFRDVQALIYSIPWNDLMVEINRENVPNPFAPKQPKAPRAIRLGDIQFRPAPEM